MADNKVNSGLLEFSEDQKVFVALDAETSEVQKAVTIDGDGVETDIQGVQPSGKKEITSTAEVNVANYATAQVVDEDLVAGNIKKDVDILGVVGIYEPEAPASDFSTAEVTLINSTGTNMAALIPAIYEAEPPLAPDAYVTGIVSILANETLTLNVPLYKGHCTVVAGVSGDRVLGDTVAISYAVTSGSATSLGRDVDITGDCAITISAANN